MKKVVLILCLCFCYFGYAQKSTKGFKTLKEVSADAVASKKNIVLVFVSNDNDLQYLHKNLTALSDAFIIHTINTSTSNGLTENQNLLNQRLTSQYNKQSVFPSLYVLDQYANQLPHQLLDVTDNKLNEFVKALKPM